MKILLLSATLQRFVASEQAGGIRLIICTIVSLALTNSRFGEAYSGLWHAAIGPLSVEQWVNEGLMAVFFLLIGLELERELYVGELSDLRNALLPIVAAIGGICAPALIHYALNAGTPAQGGAGIPMATDIAFALGVLALLGNRIPVSLKVFVVAFAIMDDLGAIVIIAAFYTAQLSFWYLLAALSVWVALIVLNRFRVMALFPYLAGGALMWFLMLKSGVHATIAGVLLAFAIPFTARDDDQASPSHRLERMLHAPGAFVILPVFALANTCIVIGSGALAGFAEPNSIGIVAGLVIGKPLGIVLLCLIATKAGLCRLPDDVGWTHLFGAGILGGIGFTMSIFIANLAFGSSPGIVNSSKMAILLASLIAGIGGYVWLWIVARGRNSNEGEAPPEPSR